MNNCIKLQPESILQVPLIKYGHDFKFIVNDEEFYTNQIVADLLSPKISKMHFIDPTICEFTINTRSKGDFSEILKLSNFETQPISSNNSTYLFEIFSQLGTTNVNIDYLFGELTIDNVIDRIKIHENISCFDMIYTDEIDFLSCHFSEVLESKKNDLFTISNNSLENVIKNTQLKLSSEDELLSFINEGYLHDKSFSNLYEYVYFVNVESSTISEFVEIINDEDLTRGAWKSISKRLVEEIKTKREKIQEERYVRKIGMKGNLHEISYSGNDFEGILNYLKNNFEIKNEIDITSSSVNQFDGHDPFEIIDNGNKSRYFLTNNEINSWICIEFKNYKISPNNYTLRSSPKGGSDYM